MKKDFFEEFKNEFCDVGIPHRFIDNRLFYYTGRVIELTDEFLVLKNSKEVKQISLKDIKEIRKHGGG